MKKALFPFFNFLILDQRILSSSNVDMQFNLSIPKKLTNKTKSNNYNENSNLIVFNKKNINELSLNLISNIKDSNLMIKNEKEIIFNSEISLFELMSYYRVLLSKNLPPNIKLIEKVYTSEKEIFNFKDLNQKNHKSNEIVGKKSLDDKEIVNFLNLQSFFIDNFETKSNNKNFYGWNIYDEKRGFTIFIGFNNQKIIGCYISQINMNKKNYNSDNLINNSCVNVVKNLL